MVVKLRDSCWALARKAVAHFRDFWNLSTGMQITWHNNGRSTLKAWWLITNLPVINLTDSSVSNTGNNSHTVHLSWCSHAGPNVQAVQYTMSSLSTVKTHFPIINWFTSCLFGNTILYWCLAGVRKPHVGLCVAWYVLWGHFRRLIIKKYLFTYVIKLIWEQSCQC